jgi:dephospho-CoA kinase
LTDNLEHDMLAVHRDTIKATVESNGDILWDDQDYDNAELQCQIKSHQEALQHLQQLKLYCRRNTRKKKVISMCRTKQVTIESFQAKTKCL